MISQVFFYLGCVGVVLSLVKAFSASTSAQVRWATVLFPFACFGAVFTALILDLHEQIGQALLLYLSSGGACGH